MKKLNKKGFTLVELLAVIVILAVIMVITIPTVLGSMGNAKQKAYDSAKKTIEEYVEKQYQVCMAGLGNLAGPVNSNILDSDCKPASGIAANIEAAAGYSTTDIDVTNVSIDANGNATITATAGANGQFSGVTN